MPELDEYTEGARYGYCLAWMEARELANSLGAEGVIGAADQANARTPDRTIGVELREGGQYSLYCYDCGEWVPNTANAEMLKEGAFAHSHFCKEEASD